MSLFEKVLSKIIPTGIIPDTQSHQFEIVTFEYTRLRENAVTESTRYVYFISNIIDLSTFSVRF